MRTALPGIGWPTVPIRSAPGVLTQCAAQVSVSP